MKENEVRMNRDPQPPKNPSKPPSRIFRDSVSWRIEVVGKRTGIVRISEEDIEAAGRFRWRLMRSGYVETKTGGNAKERSPLLLHRLIMKPPNGLEVDHIDGNPMNCRRENMRLVTHQQNRQNNGVQRRNSTGVRNVHVHVKGGYYVRLARKGKCHYGGYFKDLDEAAKAAAALRAHICTHHVEARCEIEAEDLRDR